MIGKPKFAKVKRAISLQVPTEFYLRIETVANYQGRSVSNMCRLMLDEALNAAEAEVKSSPAQVEFKRVRAATKKVIGR